MHASTSHSERYQPALTHVSVRHSPNSAWQHATDESVGRALKVNVFSRFYAEILFQHFDADNNGTLQIAEVEKALKFLVKPKEGETAELAVAFPGQGDGAEVNLPFAWFWAQYQAMD